MKTRTTLLILSSVALLAGACAKESSDASSDKGAAATDKPAKDKPADDKPGEPAPSVESLMAEYEAIRAQLANDSTDGIRDHAKRIQTIAGKLEQTSSAEAKPHLAAAGAAAAKLAGTDSGDIAATRMAFGDVSEALVSLREANPELAKSSHMFECPMAKGYKRWIQPTAELENPYMGQKMLECGSEVGTE